MCDFTIALDPPIDAATCIKAQGSKDKKNGRWLFNITFRSGEAGLLVEVNGKSRVYFSIKFEDFDSTTIHSVLVEKTRRKIYGKPRIIYAIIRYEGRRKVPYFP